MTTLLAIAPAPASVAPASPLAARSGDDFAAEFDKAAREVDTKREVEPKRERPGTRQASGSEASAKDVERSEAPTHDAVDASESSKPAAEGEDSTGEGASDAGTPSAPAAQPVSDQAASVAVDAASLAINAALTSAATTPEQATQISVGAASAAATQNVAGADATAPTAVVTAAAATQQGGTTHDVLAESAAAADEQATQRGAALNAASLQGSATAASSGGAAVAQPDPGSNSGAPGVTGPTAQRLDASPSVVAAPATTDEAEVSDLLAARGGETQGAKVLPQGMEAVSPRADSAVNAVATSPVSSNTSTAQAQAPVASAPPALATQLSGQLTSLKQLPLGEHKLTLMVNPESFGPVKVIAHITAESVSVQLVGASEQATQALRSVINDLRRDLAAAGLGAQLDVGADAAGGNARGMSEAFAGSQEGKRQGLAQPQSTAAAASQAQPNQLRPQSHTSGSRGGLDLEI